MYCSILCLFFLTTTSHSIVGPTNLEIDKLAHKHWTDKGSWGHNYVEQYDQFFKELRHAPVNLLEIGFYHGSSAYLWDDYFTHENAKLHHLDIDRSCYQYTQKLSSRSMLHMVDQSNHNDLQNFASQNGEFDIIIDDGSHIVDHQITSFKALFPFLKSGGIYIIEDLFSSYWKEYGGKGTRQHPQSSEKSTTEFLKKLLDDINWVGAKNAYGSMDVCPDHIKNSLSYYQKNIKSMHFYSNICFIIKR